MVFVQIQRGTITGGFNCSSIIWGGVSVCLLTDLALGPRPLIVFSYFLFHLKSLLPKQFRKIQK